MHCYPGFSGHLEVTYDPTSLSKVSQSSFPGWVIHLPQGQHGQAVRIPPDVSTIAFTYGPNEENERAPPGALCYKGTNLILRALPHGLI